MKKKIIISVSLIVVVLVMALVLFFMSASEPTVNYTDDEIKFKDEYESLNGIEIAENYVLKTIDIDSDNNVKYINDDEIIDKLTNGTNVIYFGWADCNWCRTVIPVLIETLKANNIETLYYYDFKSLRTAYENDNDDKSVELYKNILEIIGDDIETVFDENSEKSGEKKILAPTVIFIKNGQYVGLHFKSVDSQENSTDELTKDEKQELKSKYQTLLDEINNNNVCTSDEGC